jgi:hypothetical protein
VLAFVKVRRLLPGGKAAPIEMPIWHLRTSVAMNFQVANTWTKITARDVYATVTKRKELENPQNLLVAATLEKANTYVFAGCPIRNAEARSSTLLCSTISQVSHDCELLLYRL